MDNAKYLKRRVRFYVMSDMHIGDGSDRDDYLKGSLGYYRLATELNRIEQEITMDSNSGYRSEVVFLGDIVNGEYGYYNCYAKSSGYRLVKDFLSEYKHLSTYVVGNHDADASFYSDVAGFSRTRVVQYYKSCGVLFIHGHQFDPLCNRKTPIGMLGDLASKFAANMMSPDNEDDARGAGQDAFEDKSTNANITQANEAIPKDMKSGGVGMSSSDYSICKHAVIRANALGCANVICGHTHQHKTRCDCIIAGKRISYFNVGKFARDRVSQLIFNDPLDNSEDTK